MKKCFTVFVFIIMLAGMCPDSYADITIHCWFPPHWLTAGPQAKAITDALSGHSGILITPRIARNYREMLEAFTAEEYVLAYAGSFVQAIIISRDLGLPLVQNVNGKHMYSGMMIYPKGEDPQSILEKYPEQIAYTIGASSGESCAKAATGGKAAIGVVSHSAAAGSVKVGKARAAFVKNWWWDENRDKFPELVEYKVPEISLEKNPDNVLTASKSVPPDLMEKIKTAAIASKAVFEADQMAPFDKSQIQFSIELMKKGKIDPMSYEWN
jgi:ABC-type phosphate/phosphonate transport system substrate-binding protein